MLLQYSCSLTYVLVSVRWNNICNLSLSLSLSYAFIWFCLLFLFLSIYYKFGLDITFLPKRKQHLDFLLVMIGLVFMISLIIRITYIYKSILIVLLLPFHVNFLFFLFFYFILNLDTNIIHIINEQSVPSQHTKDCMKSRPKLNFFLYAHHFIFSATSGESDRFCSSTKK